MPFSQTLNTDLEEPWILVNLLTNIPRRQLIYVPSCPDEASVEELSL